MFFPYFRETTIEDLYDILTNYESSDEPELRAYFNRLINWKWRIIFRDRVIIGRMTFHHFVDFYQFVKFAYIVYPKLHLSLFYEQDF